MEYNIITYFAKEANPNDYVPFFMRMFMNGTRIASFVITIVIWAVVGFIISKKARELSLNPTVHFLLPFLLHLVGLAISLILIDKQKKFLFSQNMYRNQQPYGGYGQQPNYGQQDQRFSHPLYDDKLYKKPYGEMYGQQTYTGNPMNARGNYCSCCGHQQEDGNFCYVCGSKLK